MTIIIDMETFNKIAKIWKYLQQTRISKEHNAKELLNTELYKIPAFVVTFWFVKWQFHVIKLRTIANITFNEDILGTLLNLRRMFAITALFDAVLDDSDIAIM